MYNFFCCIPVEDEPFTWFLVEHVYNSYEQAGRKAVMLRPATVPGKPVEVWVKKKKRKFEVVRKFYITLLENYKCHIEEQAGAETETKAQKV